MITPPPGWTAELRQSGLLMVPPEGVECGLICYRDHCQPIQRVPEILGSLSTPAGWAPASISRIERLVTVEGEHAALVSIGGTLDGVVAELTLGVVFADSFYTTTIALARHPGEIERFRATVRDLVVNDTFMLGARRRRFVHAPPAGWHGFLSGQMHATWVPIDYPRTTATLTVFPALPVRMGERGLAEVFVRDHASRLGADHVDLTGAAVTSTGLSGQIWRITSAGDAEATHYIAVLEDDRYLYPVALESFVDERDLSLAVLMEVVESIEPIPNGDGPSAQTCADIVAHWID